MNNLELLTCSTLDITYSYKVTAIVTSVLTIPMAIIAILGNLLFIFLLIRNKRLRSQSNILLGSLCFTDLLIGFIGQPIFVARRILEIKETRPVVLCELQKVHIYFAYLGVGASVTTLAIVSLDRWFAICRPFLYQELQSTRKCVVIITADWVVLMLLMVSPYIAAPSFIIYIGASIVMMVSILTIIACYTNIYIVLLRHRKQISEQTTVSQAEPSEVRDRRPVEKRRTNTIAIIIVTLFACYAPHIITICMKSFTGRKLLIESRICETIIMMNSSINPVIYCLRSTEIKTAVKDLLHQVFTKT